jgi:rhodanese-related sulfurtransferase
MPATPTPAVVSSRQMVQDALAQVHTLSATQAMALQGQPGVLFVDIREPVELQREGVLSGATLAPRGLLEFWVDPASEWHRPVFSQPGVHLVLYCALGWRSALAAKTLQDMGLPRVSHLGGGLAAWKAAGGPVDAWAGPP